MYDAEKTRSYFDAFGEREWHRLDATLQGRVKHAVHRRLLEAYITPGMHVIDVGCGPGRFAIDVASMGGTVTLVDLSQVQLDIAHQRIAEHGVLERVDGMHRLDVLDLSSLDAGAYDAVVYFGGAISYTMGQHMDALHQLARVAKPGAPILVSVMSVLGALRLIGPLDAAAVLETPDAHLDWAAVLAGAGVVYTNPTSKEFHHPMVLFTADGLRTALSLAGLEPAVVATSNPLFPEFMQISRIVESPAASAALVKLEVALSQQPGLSDAGGQLLAVARKPG